MTLIAHPTHTDHELAERLRNGDATAITESHSLHQAAIFSAARSILRDREAAFDVTQDVMTHLWQQPEKFDPDRGSLRTYLLARTRSRALDIVRSETSRKRRESRVKGDHRTEAGVDEMVVDAATAEQLRGRLSSLKDSEREAISLAFFGDMSYRQVAERLGIPEGTAKSRIRAGLANLRLVYGESAA
ncbi:MAG: sigma-70 family RNA polymerase sigma factor [Acidimicrobiia bacterium]|nr:sigma-70 family RNA polymerase sigma factor [Acidimicrobiia bacterium]